MTKGPIFLIASERSGTTLLRVMLDSHPRICAPAPPHLLAVFPQILHLYGNLGDGEGLRRLAGDMLQVFEGQLGRWRSSPGVDDLMLRCGERSFAGLFNALYSIESEWRGKSRYFVKDNGAGRSAFFIHTVFPDACFIYLVRDPRDVVASWLESPPHFGGTDHAAEVWSRDQEEALQAYSVLRERGRIHLVHYEDLVGRTGETLREICGFLGEEYSPRLLEYHLTDEARASASAVDAWKNVASPVMKENVAAYHGRLTPAQVRKVEELAGAEMALLGYSPSGTEGGSRSSLLSSVMTNRYLEAARRLIALLTGKAGRREVGRRVARLGRLKEVERRARSTRRPWSAPGRRD